ncbi:hypothetical protein M378DRAFT_13655 [Amanita muscaria Koide BX008]|uniref:Uncharacterized protein n=1 Tax=Amanita muscaria (strain Koide BX008) TaxID=946122 RepID=A0A0C2WI93_AMAMK|nr:hypothetical protein M378DRAFT_13655 [Amanita muscaria Koide BX008]
MSSASKGKPKADCGEKTGPSIPVEETPHELSREERPFRLNRKERLRHLSPIPPSHSRTASGGPSESGKSQEYLPVLEATPNPNIGDKNRSHYPSETFKPADRGMGSVDRASEKAIVDTEYQSVDFPMSTLEEIAEHCRQTPQDSIQGSKRYIQVMGTIGEGVFREKLDKGKGRENEGLHEAGGPEFLAAIQPRQDYDNSGTLEAGDREISRDQLPAFGVPSSQDVAYNYAIHGGTCGAPLIASRI